jgi:amino acid transporter
MSESNKTRSTDSTSKELSKKSISLLGLVIISMAGTLAIIGPMEVSSFVGSAGPAAMWPVILGFLLFIIVSLPIFEYTKFTNFAGGYYGLAELGFGKAVGKYTALSNYTFYIFWQVTNFFAMSAIIVDSVYLLYNYMIPIWGWLLIGVAVLILTNVMSSLHPKILSKVLIYITIATTILVLGFVFYVILKSPYNSAYYVNPLNSYSGFTGIAKGTAIYGFFLFVGYGSTLFYSEEAKNGRKDVWKAIYIGLGISALVIALSAYSVVATVPSSKLGAISSSTLPELVSWIHYIPAPALLILSFIVVVISMLSFGAGAGSQSRLMWSMARDQFIDSIKLRKLSKNKTPTNAIILQFIVVIVFAFSAGGALVAIYGYSISTITIAWFAAGAGGTVVWYFHHFIPEFGLFPYINKHKELKYSFARKWIIGIVVPLGGTALFLYTFYLGIVSDLLEPYFSFMLIAVAALLGIVIYVTYKAKTNKLGESTVSYMAAEAEQVELSNDDETDK